MKIADVFPWGKQWPPPNDAGNYFGEECKTAAGLANFKAAEYDVSSWPVIKGFNDGKVSRHRREVSVRTDSEFMTWEGMSGSGARTNTNRVRPRGCCAAVRGAVTTATACCRPNASPRPRWSAR